MNTFCTCCSLLILATFTSAGFAQTTVAWKLKEGDVFYAKQTRKSEQKLTVQESIIRQELKSTSISQFKVEKHAEGKLVLQQKFESITATAGQDNPGIKEMLARLSGATLTFHLDDQFRVTKVDGYDTLLQKLVKGDSGLEKTARTVVPEAELRDVVQQLFDFVPKKPVEKGAAWESTQTESFGPLGTLKVTNNWSFDSASAETNTARTTGTQKITLDTAEAGKGLPFQIKAGIVKKTDAKLDVVFDLAKGRLKQRTLHRQLQLQFLIEKDKRSLDMHIEQNSTVTLEILDKAPATK